MARFEEIDRNSGVDSLRPGAEWIMVPKGKSNIVCLTGGAGYGVKAVEGKSYVKIDVISEDKYADEIGRINALFIGKDDKLLRITGLQRGPGKIAATKGSDKAELKFSVHGSRTFNISFFFLHDLDAQNRSTPQNGVLAEGRHWLGRKAEPSLRAPGQYLVRTGQEHAACHLWARRGREFGPRPNACRA